MNEREEEGKKEKSDKSNGPRRDMRRISLWVKDGCNHLKLILTGFEKSLGLTRCRCIPNIHSPNIHSNIFPFKN